MAPRSRNFNTGSVAYFMGNKSESVFLLKEGKVKLTSIDIETGTETVDMITTGEFFGVKSGLIRYPREETATAVTDSLVIEFSTADFDALITKNTSIILKMLKAFSNQLRRIGKQAQTMAGNKVSTNLSDDLFQIGDYYLRNKKYKQAITVYKRYLQYYSDGRLVSICNVRLKIAMQALDSYGEGGGPTPVLEDTNASNTYEPVPEIPHNSSTIAGNSEEEKLYYKGVSLFSQAKYVEAFNEFKKTLSMNNNNVILMSGFEIGKCLFNLGKFSDCVGHYSNLLKKYPNYSESASVFFYMALCYQKLGNKDNTIIFLKKVLQSSNQDDNINRKAQKLLKELE